MLREQGQKRAAARLKESDPLLLERIREQQKLQHVLRMSWSGLFDALESAGRHVGGRATILSLVPVRTEAGSAQIGITALAVSNQFLVDYIKALERDPHVREVRLAAQRPALNGGVEVVRFEITVLWEPRG